jgi:DNA-binding beta-propeller fold protein YncE
MPGQSRLVEGLFVLYFAFAASLPAQEPPASPAAPSAEAEPRRLPGMQRGGEILLPTQWSLRPVGTQIKLGDFPVNISLHPSEPWAAVLHSGYGEHEVAIVDLEKRGVVSKVRLDRTFYGVTFDPAGKRLFASGGEDEVVHQFDFASGYLSARKELRIAGEREKFIPAGLTVSGDGRTLYVACPWGQTLCMVPLEEPEKKEHIKLEEGSYPYASLVSRDGKRLFVSLWGASGVAVIDLETRKQVATWPTESHPTEMALSPEGGLLYVACANSNTVSVLDTGEGKPLEVISSALYPQAPRGSTPNSLSLTPDGKVLFIANADNNNIAMFNVSQRGKSHSMGFLPAGWYPTSVRYNPTDKRIYIANGKGLMPRANRQGPRPGNEPPATVREYIGGLYRGTMSVIDTPGPVQMAAYTKTAYECSPLRSDASPVLAPPRDNPIPAKLGDKSPIKHCIYIIKENRTYDQVFGDMPEGNGDPHLCIFPEKVTPNHHALAREFVLLDNFYVESEVSADGHEWSMAAYATDYVEKAWPLEYRPGSRGKIGYPSEGGQPIAFPAGGYIWDRCAAAGVSYRSYGEFIRNNPIVGQPGKATVKALEGHFDPLYRSYDLDYPDAKRADRFIEELGRYEREGGFPQFIVLRLPNDHTYGTRVGKPTPTAMVAENDLALGRLVEAVSKSKFWKETALFVVEDDAQNGSDHVDAHRTVALVISPYTKRKFVDSTMYSTASMLRTMELVLGLQPMSQFDAAARPMYNSFQSRPDLSPYQHRPANVDLTAVNQPGAWGAELSAKLDLSKEDAADDLLFNDIIWRSVRGPNSPMPPPVRASFVIVHAEEEDDDDDEDTGKVNSNKK